MHGLVNRSFQLFLRDTYGLALWADVAADCGISADGFEAMLLYDRSLIEQVLASASARLSKPQRALLEDYGAYLITFEPVRRLLRFGGIDYPDFLESLDELPGRARMAVDDLILPEIELRPGAAGHVALILKDGWSGFGPALAGVLRRMADDYGALALIDVSDDGATVQVNMLEERFAVGREFRLAGAVA